MRLSFDSGKYEVIFDERTGTLEALRHGEPWRTLTGDNLILSMAQEVEALRGAAPASPAKPPYANMGEYLADLEAHASPAKEAEAYTLANCPDCEGQSGYPRCPTCKNAPPTREGETPGVWQLYDAGSAIEGKPAVLACKGSFDWNKAVPLENLLSEINATLQRGNAAERRAADAEAGERTELSSVAKLLAFQPPYQARLAKRVEAIIAERDNLKERLTAAESERDALRKELRDLIEWADTMWSSRPAAARFPLTNVAIERAREALAPASETTTTESQDFAQVEDIARASLASLYSCMDHSVLPHVRKKIEDYISLLKRQAVPPKAIPGKFLPEDPTHFDHLHAIRAVIGRSISMPSSGDDTLFAQIYNLADAGMNLPPTSQPNN